MNPPSAKHLSDATPATKLRRVLFGCTEQGTARRILILLLAPYAVIVWWALQQPDMLLTADIRTEYVSFDVIDRQKAAFYIKGFKIGVLGRPGICEEGLFTPSLGTRVAYGRSGDGAVEITVTPLPRATAVGLLDHGQGNAQRFTEALVMEQDKSCLPPGAEAPAARLPIWGQAQIGREFQPASGFGPPDPSLLLEGKVNVSAHAFLTGSLYEVREFSLPVASRLETSTRTIWWGIAYVEQEKTALVVALATQAPQLALYRPNQTDAELISLTTLVQLTDDPTIIRIHILIAVFGALILIAGGIAEHAHDLRDRRA